METWLTEVPETADLDWWS